MTTLTLWATRHHIPPAALADLRAILLSDAAQPAFSGDAVRDSLRVKLDPDPVEGLRSEAAVQQAVRLEASRKGCRLWRNNVGAAVDARGVPIRFGLANDSKEMNARIKSSDLIGIRPDGRMLVRECKPEDWVYRGTDRERAQLKFIELIIGMGGDACFVTREGSI